MRKINLGHCRNTGPRYIELDGERHKHTQTCRSRHPLFISSTFSLPLSLLFSQTHTHSHTRARTHTHTHTHTYIHTHTYKHTHTHTHTYIHTHTITHTHTQGFITSASGVFDFLYETRLLTLLALTCRTLFPMNAKACYVIF